MVHDLFYRSHPFERQLSLHFRIVGKVFFKLIIRISDSQRPSPASERQLTIWLILFYHVFRTVSTFFLRVCQWTMPLPVCSVCCSFFCGDRRWCGTRSSIPAICVPRIAHFFLHKVLKTAPAWHTNPEFSTLCAKVIRCPAEKRRPPGTQTSNLPLRLLRTAAALSFSNFGRIVEAGSTAAFLLFPICGRINEQFARPQLCLFSFAAVSARKVVRPHSAFSLFAAV